MHYLHFSFCPSLKVLSKKMAMSDNVAGVTLLALGNGAPGTSTAILFHAQFFLF